MNDNLLGIILGIILIVFYYVWKVIFEIIPNYQQDKQDSLNIACKKIERQHRNIKHFKFKEVQ